ncbi:MAG TPA: TlyA family RNA methyltransferase [Vicinamibacterales bacterium]|nr:TlyA family RNA methyltransferase [Vicinamibacterales bacterium]
MKQRLDQTLVRRQLAPSRERARALILAGKVRVNAQVQSKAGHLVAADAAITVDEPDHPYVGRGGLKLAHALDTFRIDPAGRDVLDIGASTGGFTDVCLRRGAAHVVALDVGHNQIDWALRSDARVTVIERVNARALTPDQLPPAHRRFGLVTIDVSFISLRHILPVVPPLVDAGSDVVALVKPQFEAGRGDIESGGIVRSADVHTRVVDEMTAAAAEAGLERRGLTPSPITGAEGNQEFLVWLRLVAGSR